MNEQEKEYISTVKSVVSLNKDLEELVVKLAEISIPEGKLSFNTQFLADYIKGVEFDYDNEALFDYTDDGDWKTQEQKAALIIKQNVEQIVTDIEKSNWYKERVVELEFGYSRPKDGKYLYKIVHKSIDTTIPEEANMLLEKLKPTIPKEHPEAPEYTLEYSKALVEVVDSTDKVFTFKV